MEVVIETAGRLAALAADAVESLVRRRPDAVLGLATGSSPVTLYDELVARHRAGLSFARVRGFLLDEYVGLPPGHPESYRAVIDRHLTSHLDLAPGAVQGPDGGAADLAAACAAYEAALQAAGGVDLQVLGVGTDGHLAFNEPGSSLASRTRVKTLTAQTRRDNARFFGDDPEAVPRHVLTQGLGTILEARHLVLVATGRAKAEAVHQLVEGPVSALWPATVLQLHPHVSVLVDEAAASRLQLAGYYREAWTGKAAVAGAVGRPGRRLPPMSQTTGPEDPYGAPGDGTSTSVLERTEAREELEPGDRERFSHYVRKEKILESAMTGNPVVALCGKVWVPGRDPKKFPVCPVCKEIYDGLREPQDGGPGDSGGSGSGGSGAGFGSGGR